MKQVSLVMTLGVVCIILFSSNVRSEEVERVYEEELVLTDPTVSEEGQWRIGASVEAWYVDHPLYVQKDGQIKKTANVSGFQPGVSGFLAYGSWTFMASYRQGDFDVTDVPGVFLPEDTDEDRTEIEVRLRYLNKKDRFLGFKPYIIAGYNRTSFDRDKMKIPVSPYTLSGTNTLKTETELNSFSLGLGGIYPFTNKLGLRFDVSGAYIFDATHEITNCTTAFTALCAPVDDTGFGGVAHITGYWNITKRINLQVGAKGTALDAGNAGRFDRIGFFAMLGVTHNLGW